MVNSSHSVSISVWYIYIYPRPQVILLIEQSSQSENSYHVIRSILRLTHNWKLFPDTVNRMFHHFHYECHGPIIIRDFQWQKQLICLTFSFKSHDIVFHLQTHIWMLLRIFFLLLSLFFSFFSFLFVASCILRTLSTFSGITFLWIIFCHWYVDTNLDYSLTNVHTADWDETHPCWYT